MYFAGFQPQIIDIVNSPKFSKEKIKTMRFFSYAGALFTVTQGVEIERKLGIPILNFYGTMDAHMYFI